MPKLNPVLDEKLKVLADNVLLHHGYSVRRGHGPRSPWDQARLWRRSRSRAVVEEAARTLSLRGAPYLSGVLLGVGPQPSGPWATNSLPGQGWHQWLEAQDFWVVGPGGKPEWDGDHRGYQALAEEAARLGLTSGWFWRNKDAGHVQVRRESGPHLLYTWPEIDSTVRSLWGDSEA